VLIDRLGRADTVKFGRTIGGEHQEGHEGLRRFGHAGVQLRRGSSARHHNRDRLSRDESTPERKESGASFVNSYVHT
jgi:hypothetical protein